MNTSIRRVCRSVYCPIFRQATLGAAVAACLCLPAAAGTLYRWVDARGVVNYSSEPPPSGSNVQAVTQRSMTSYDASAALAAAERQNRELQARLDRLQKEVDELKQVLAAAPTAPSATYLPVQPASPQRVAAACANDPRTNCSRGLAPEFDYPQVVFVRAPIYIVPVVPIVPATLPRTRHHSTSASGAAGLNVRFRLGSLGRIQN